jgi:hypothetical protein
VIQFSNLAELRIHSLVPVRMRGSRKEQKRG